MNQADYLYNFTDVRDGLCTVSVVASHKQEVTEIRAGIGDDELTPISCTVMPDSIADMVDLALAVYTADRLSCSLDGNQCRIQVDLPVRHPELLGKAHVTDQLQHLLYLYTGDDWSFAFRKRTASARLPERQAALMNAVDPTTPKEVALWSGGLDSLAGLYSRRRTLHTAQSYTLLGTGGNSIVHEIQRSVVQAARAHFPDIAKRPITLIQVPIRLSDTGHMRKNGTPRTRGFVFLLLGAVCAVLEGQDVLQGSGCIARVRERYRSS